MKFLLGMLTLARGVLIPAHFYPSSDLKGRPSSQPSSVPPMTLILPYAVTHDTTLSPRKRIKPSRQPQELENNTFSIAPNVTTILPDNEHRRRRRNRYGFGLNWLQFAILMAVIVGFFIFDCCTDACLRLHTRRKQQQRDKEQRSNGNC